MISLFFIIVFLLIIQFTLGVILGSVRRKTVIEYIQVPYRDFPHEKGNIELGHGWNELFVPTSQQPRRVWLCFEEFEGVQTCLGQVDMLNSYSTPEGFVVLANINAERAYVKWIAEFV